jgi:hypothetical protein
MARTGLRMMPTFPSPPPNSRVEDWRGSGRLPLAVSAVSSFVPAWVRHGPVSSPRLVKPSVLFSGTGLSSLLRVTGYATYRPGVLSGGDPVMGDPLQSTSPWAGDRCGAARRTRSGAALLGGAAPISCGKVSEGKDRCGLQRGSGPVGAWWPYRSCPASPASRRTSCRLCGMTNSTWETTSLITHYHIANAQIRAKVERACRVAGYEPPILCTPDELMAGEDHDA